jgi:hypothetical protein
MGRVTRALSILYRGPLDSCNYACGYCRFGKQKATRKRLDEDRAALSRFVDWCVGQNELHLDILFTPWGEALIHSHYREAMGQLARAPHIARVAIQTNLSSSVSWMTDLPPGKAQFWCTFHPGETDADAFLKKCLAMRVDGIAFSVGIVGAPDHLAIAQWLRARLPDDVYLWVNALSGRARGAYDSGVAEDFAAIDPLFSLNCAGARSLGRACGAGERAIAVDGDGTMRRCHFIAEPIGNIYAEDWRAALTPRPCAARFCRCHIGYVHMPELRLDEVFGTGLLSRIPARKPTLEDAQLRAPLMGLRQPEAAAVSLPAGATSGECS